MTARRAICQLVHSLHVGGAELLAVQYARALADDYRVHLLCLDEVGPLGEALRAQGCRVAALNRQPGFDWRCVLRLARVLREERIELVHAHQYTPFFYAALARQLHVRTAVLFQEHGRHFPDYPRPRRILANRLLLKDGDRVVAVGGAVREALQRNEGIPASRIRTIYNGVNLAPFLANGQDRQAIRRSLGLAATDFVAITVARLDYLKDHATAVTALARLRAEMPAARLVLVGEGPERQRVEQQVQSLGLGDAVLLLGLRKDVDHLLHAADAFLLTSISEGIPLTVIEAMAAGLPVVATDVGGVREVVLHGESGFLTPAKDAAAIAERLRQLAQQPVLAAEMGRRGRQRALDHFSAEQMNAAYRRLYAEMLGGRR